MKILLCFLGAVMLITSCGVLGKVNWDSQKIASAAGKTLTAVSISDAEIIQLSKQSVEALDAKNEIDTGAYSKRLQRLVAGMPAGYNFKVYKTSEINAFACGDGSIRVYSGLMDVMEDDELMAIIGHEIGHVVHKDTKNAMKKAYLASAASDLVGSAGSVGALSQALVGNIAESFVNAQFSQKQEYKADDYGYDFAVSLGYSPYSMAKALDKLVSLSKSSGSKASAVAQMFSSHPDSESRAARMRTKANSASK